MTCFKMKEHVDSVDLIVMDLLDPVKEYTGKELDTWPYWELYSFYPDSVNGHGEYCSNGTWEGTKDNLPSGFQAVPVTKHYYYKWKNGMRLGAYKDGQIVEVGRVASGLTDEMREDMAAHPENYVGKVAQISCMSLNKKDHTIRHPVFECMRPDKDENDCLLDEIFN